MFNFFKKKEKNNPTYVIAFCDENDLSTKFGEDGQIFENYDSAKYRIFSKVSGYGKAIQYHVEDSAKIDGAWLIIEKRD